MAIWETIASGVIGGVAGAGTAYLTARGKVNAVRAEFDGKLRELQIKRSHELDDRHLQAAADQQVAAGRQSGALRLAATNLVSALRNPDAMKRNVSVARREVAEAASALETGTELAELAQRLHQASERGDLTEAEAVLQALRIGAD